MQLTNKQLTKLTTDLTRLKQKKGITKKTVSNLLGIAPSMLSNILRFGIISNEKLDKLNEVINKYK